VSGKTFTPEEVIELRVGGSGFAAHDGERAVASKWAPGMR
jgi:hypothetical protein